jgi:hypothetical protein
MRNRLTPIMLVALAATGANALYIDDFSSGSFTVVAGSANPRVEAVRSGAGILGGERDVMLDWISGPQFASGIINGDGHLYMNTDAETVGRLYLQYDGFDGELENDLVQTPGTGLNANLTGFTDFVFRFRAVNGTFGSDIATTILVTSSTGTVSHTVFTGSGLNQVTTASFGSFSGVDWSNVQRLDFIFNGNMSSDWTLDSIEVVPEPATMAVLGLGAAALMRRRRRSA